jgi:hypothetical protein
MSSTLGNQLCRPHLVKKPPRCNIAPQPSTGKRNSPDCQNPTLAARNMPIFNVTDGRAGMKTQIFRETGGSTSSLKVCL